MRPLLAVCLALMLAAPLQAQEEETAPAETDAREQAAAPTEDQKSQDQESQDGEPKQAGDEADQAKKGGEEADTYDQSEILKRAEAFFGEGAKGLAKIVEKAFKDHGRPTAYITGEEGGGAIAVGARYGKGTLHMKAGPSQKLYWRGPSIGFDIGGNVNKTFVLVYDLHDVEDIFQRYPGVEGSLYFVAGVGVNYLQRGDIILAPMRLGVGWRQGASVGYLHITREKSWIPF